MNSTQKVLWIEEFGRRKLSKEILSILKIFKTIFFYKKIKFFYCVLPTSVIGLIKIIFILKLINLVNKDIKYMFHIHRSDLIKNFNKNIFVNLLFRYIKKNHNSIHCIFVISMKLKKDLDRLFKKKIKIIIKKNSLSIKHKIRAQKKNLLNKKIKLIYLSNILKSKGILHLCKKISKTNFNKLYELTIYGKILDLPSEKFFQNNKFENIFLKKTLKDAKEKFNTLKKYDALILPSKNEGDPLCIIESMSIGLPVICYNVGYIEETLGKKYDLYLDNNSMSMIYTKLTSKKYYKKISNYLLKTFKQRDKKNILADKEIKNFLT
jgi:glycosyltransferase involved in cell wall biosynthesis